MKTGVARRYAEAVFEIAREHDSFDRWAKELEVIARAQEQPQMGAILSNPAVAMSVKEQIAAEYLPDLSPEASNLVKLLLHKGRFPLARQIADHYRRMVNDFQGIATAQVISAVPLSAEEMRGITRRLSDMTGRTVIAEPQVDPSILGGIVARIGDQLIDASVRSRLEALKRRLATA